MQDQKENPHGLGAGSEIAQTDGRGPHGNHTHSDVYASINDIDRARDALFAIPADLPRDEWARLCFAAQDAGLSFDDFASWSAQTERFNAADCRDTWRSCARADGANKVTAATLIYEAKRHGWRDTRKATERAVSRVEAQRKPKAGHAPAEVWARSVAATDAHGYAMRKGLVSDVLEGLRVLPDNDPLSIAGRSMAGALAVPGYDQNGELQTIQFIPPDGEKMNLPGCAMSGASFPVGTIQKDSPLYLVEGIGQASAVRQATGCAAIACFGWGNVKTIATAMHQRCNRLVLVPDTGKEGDALRIATELHCSVAKMPAGEASNFDVHDLMQRDGVEALRKVLESAQAFEPEPLLVPVSVSDVLSRPATPPRSVWGSYLPRDVVSLFGAHGGTGKSTVALMLAVAAATGRPLFNVATERCRVLFASLEDAGSVVRWRLAMICRLWGIDPRELEGKLTAMDGTEHPELFACTGRDAGNVTASYAALEAAAEGMGLVIVDNASDGFGGDEINRRQVRAFVRSLARIAKHNDAAVLLLAHVDKTTSKAGKATNGEGYSGSTAWNNSARSRLFLSRDASGLLELAHQKANFGKMRAPLFLDWPEDGLPELTHGSPAATDCSLLAELDTKALLALIAEYSERGEYVTTATTSRTHAAKLLSSESSYPKSRKAAEVFGLLRQSERDEYLVRVIVTTENRKQKEVWSVTEKGREFAGLAPTAPTAPTSEVDALGAPDAEGAPTAPTSGVGGMGEKGARESQRKKDSFSGEGEPAPQSAPNRDTESPCSADEYRRASQGA